MASLAGFAAFVATVMAVPVTALPPDSQALAYAYDVATAIVNPQLACVPAPTLTPLYDLAVYNLAGSNLIEFAPDLPDGLVVPNPSPSAPAGSKVGYWAALRQQLGVNAFVAGVLQSTSDEGTSASYAVSDSIKGLSLAELQYLKTPYGRQYMALAQRAGTLWGLT